MTIHPLISIPIAFGGAIFFIGFFCILDQFLNRKERKIKKLEKLIQEEALKGNKFAFSFMLRDRSVTFSRIPIIEEAMKGNEYALEILGIKNEEKK